MLRCPKRWTQCTRQSVPVVRGRANEIMADRQDRSQSRQCSPRMGRRNTHLYSGESRRAPPVVEACNTTRHPHCRDIATHAFRSRRPTFDHFENSVEVINHLNYFSGRPVRIAAVSPTTVQLCAEVGSNLCRGIEWPLRVLSTSVRHVAAIPGGIRFDGPTTLKQRNLVADSQRPLRRALERFWS
jgi:hypothetical protein